MDDRQNLSRLEAAQELIAKSIEYANKHEAKLPSNIQKRLRECMPLRAAIASVLSEVENITSENIKKYTQILKEMILTVKELNDLQLVLDPTTLAENQIRAVSNRVMISLYAEFFELSKQTDKADKVLSQFAAVEFKDELLLPLKYPAAYQVIMKRVERSLVSFIPASHRECIEKEIENGGLAAAREYMEQLMPIWLTEGIVSFERMQRVPFMMQLLEDIVRDKELIILADKYPSEIFAVLSSEALEKVAKEMQEACSEKAIPGCVNVFISYVKQELRELLIRSNRQEVDNEAHRTSHIFRP